MIRIYGQETESVQVREWLITKEQIELPTTKFYRGWWWVDKETDIYPFLPEECTVWDFHDDLPREITPKMREWINSQKWEKWEGLGPLLLKGDPPIPDFIKEME